MRAGEVIANRFEVLGHAGSGANASVYRALDRTSSRTVAVKMLAASHPYDVARFFREAAVLSGLSHPHIVEYVSFGTDNRSTYLVQEWIDGPTLAQRMRGAGVTLAEAVAIAAGVAAALAAVHSHGIIHRDVTPGNLILAGDDPAGVKLADFGIARIASAAGSLTRTGDVLGTPSYMAPEQARGVLAIEPAADVWALGCVLYKMVTGRVAFGGKNPTAIRARLLLDRPAALDDSVPAAVRALIDEMLAKDPARRPRDGAAVGERLAALGELPASAPRTSGASEPPTLELPARRSATTCYVLYAPAEDELDAADPGLERIAASCELALYRFDDGRALLVAAKPDRDGALDAARAAMELAAAPAEAAISVFAQSSLDSFETAVERGAMLLDRSIVNVVFRDVVDLETLEGPGIYIDDTIDTLLAGALPTARTEDGSMLRASRRGR